MKTLLALFVSLAVAVSSHLASATDIFVSPTGNDTHPGTKEQPLKSLDAARDAARTAKAPVTVYLRGGTHYLGDTFVLTPKDSGTKAAPVVYAAYGDEVPTISGGVKLQLTWTPFRDGIFQAAVPADLAIDQLFVDGERQHMARYPNYDPDSQYFNGFAADAFSPARAARWKNPKGGFIHAMHRAHWGDYHYLITNKDANDKIAYIGGWQNNRQMGMHGSHRFVENIFEELDAAGEWFLDSEQRKIYFFPPEGVDLAKATIEGASLRHLIELEGSLDQPVRFITFRGLRLTHTARTFMDNKEPLLRSDWTTYRGGAIFVTGGEDIRFEGLELDAVGSNGIFMNEYNRRVTVTQCKISDAGASGVCFVGDPKAVRSALFHYNQRQSIDQVDRTPGPKTPNYPSQCVVHDNLIYRSGRFEKQTAGVQIAMASEITVSHNSIYDVPRAGINISEGTWGGHLIEGNDVFDTVKETGDHGSFNSWGRDRFWGLKGAKLSDKDRAIVKWDAMKTTIMRGNRFRCDHGWDVDLDDGSTNYHIYNNLCLHGGIKNREGFFRTVENNIMVDNGFHPHVWYKNSGDVFQRNIVFRAYRPAIMSKTEAWGETLDHNLFHSLTKTGPAVELQAASRRDEHSIYGNAMFVDSTKGDYRVKEESPALAMGFKNFPMNEFGVLSAKLRAQARTPRLPGTFVQTQASRGRRAPKRDAKIHPWLGAKIKNIIGPGEKSAAGLPAEIGAMLVDVPKGSVAAKYGLVRGDVVLKVGKNRADSVYDLMRLYTASAARQPLELGLFRDQKDYRLTIPGPRATTLAARQAQIVGPGSKPTFDRSKNYLGSWRNHEAVLKWQVPKLAAGIYEVTITLAKPEGGQKFEIVLGDLAVSGVVPNTGNWEKFVTMSLGPAMIKTAGDLTVVLRSAGTPSDAVMNFREIKLIFLAQ